METNESESDLPVIRGFSVIRRLGSGGMSDVYLAESGTDRALAAVKRIRLTSEHRHERPEDLAKRRRRLRREWQLLGAVDHPHVVRAGDWIDDDDGCLLVMEYVEGSSLRDRVIEGHRWSASRVREILADVVAGLACLHDRRIVHRDIKPANLLVTRDGRIKLADFGLAVDWEHAGELTGTGEVVGSLDYIAPEQRHRLVVDGRADQYSLAVTLYQLLTGKLPIGNFSVPSEINRSLSRSVDGVLLKALRVDPDERYATIESFGTAMDAALAKTRASRRDGWASAALVAAILVILGVTMGTGSDGRESGIATSRTVASNGDRAGDPAAAETGNRFGNVDQANTDLDAERRARQALELAAWGDSHLDAGEMSLALTAFTQAIDVQPESADWYLRRADVLWLMNRPAMAMLDLESAIARNDRLPDVYTKGSIILSVLGRYDEAIDMVNRQIALTGDSAWAYAHRAKMHYKLSGGADVIRGDLQRALALDDRCVEAYQVEALLCRREGRYQLAAENYERMLECDLQNAIGHTEFAYFLAICDDPEIRDPRRAIDLATQGCELSQWSDAQALSVLATALAADHDYVQAIGVCRQGQEIASVPQRLRLERQLRVYESRAHDAASDCGTP